MAAIADEKFDAVSFTSAPAVAAVLMRAAEMGVEDRVLTALRTTVHAMCVGPVTARPLVRLGVPTSGFGRIDASTQGESIDVHRQLDQTGAEVFVEPQGAAERRQLSRIGLVRQTVPELVETLLDHLHQRR